ncbi:hypothetical protein OUZ56_007642 [Daphnia magna]|uniref:Uncharacterized protein n=1 Tax=Daphnia magna TaxID=35525 RepID=A0ABR0AAK1_9CRUS|nr:hypothetical protein OUZ56_007642 [Daphnia magna]
MASTFDLCTVTSCLRDPARNFGKQRQMAVWHRPGFCSPAVVVIERWLIVYNNPANCQDSTTRKISDLDSIPHASAPLRLSQGGRNLERGEGVTHRNDVTEECIA